MATPRKILVVRFSSIGDIVLTTPVVRGLKKQLGAEVHYLTKAAYGAMLAPNPYIDRVWTIEREVSEVTGGLRGEGFDRVVDLHKNVRSLRLRLALGVPSITFDKLNWEKWLLVRFQVDRLPERHLVDRYWDAVARLGVEPDGGGLDYFLRPEDEVSPRQIFGEDPGGFGAFAIGAAHATKRLPPDRVRALCERLDGPVVLLGGPADREVGAAAAAGLPMVVDRCGAWSINQSASVLRQARWVISHDTGMMHIAAAFRRPIVSIWGNTVPAFGMYPYLPPGSTPAARVEVPDLPCRPCSKIGFARCPRGHFHCMRGIDLEEVVAKLPKG